LSLLRREKIVALLYVPSAPFNQVVHDICTQIRVAVSVALDELRLSEFVEYHTEMRLLCLDEHGKPSLTEFLGNKIPPYAALPHTWRPDGGEVTFKDILDGVATNRPGYTKLSFCGEKAASHGLKYFWVDTYCIDKSSSAELQESINSMFYWYSNATRCYVYLSDFSIGDYELSSRSSQSFWESSFRVSRWFTRSWTLQELLAPTSVEFFSREGKRLGDKQSLERQIHEITGIPIIALRGTSLAQFSVNERFSWAQSRNATRHEDWAYSLLGIFDIAIPLLYGEGREKAIVRLKKEINETLKGAIHMLSTIFMWHTGFPIILIS